MDERESPFSEEELIDRASSLLSAVASGEAAPFLAELADELSPGDGDAVASSAAPLVARLFTRSRRGGVRAAHGADGLLGVELEGLSSEDRELEIAKRIIVIVSVAARRRAGAGGEGHWRRRGRTIVVEGV